MNEQDKVRLLHMLEATQEALEFAAGRTRADLDSDRMLRRALANDITIIGEAASRISNELREAVSSIPWAAIIATRNRLIHAYFDIDLDRVWDTITNNLPSLLAELKKLFPPEDEEKP